MARSSSVTSGVAKAAAPQMSVDYSAEVEPHVQDPTDDDYYIQSDQAKTAHPTKFYASGQIATLTNPATSWSAKSRDLMSKLSALDFSEYFKPERKQQILSLLHEFGYRHADVQGWEFALNLVLAGIEIGKRLADLSKQGKNLTLYYDMDDTHLDFYWTKPLNIARMFLPSALNVNTHVGLPTAFQLRPTCEMLLGMRLFLDDTLFTGKGPQVVMFTNSNPTKMSSVFDSAMMQAIWLDKSAWKEGSHALSPKDIALQPRVITVTDTYKALRALMVKFFESNYNLDAFNPEEKIIIASTLMDPGSDYIKFPYLSHYMDPSSVVNGKSLFAKAKCHFSADCSALMDDNPSNMRAPYGVGAYAFYVPSEPQNASYKYTSGDGSFDNRRVGHGIAVPEIFATNDLITAFSQSLEGKQLPDQILYKMRSEQGDFANDNGNPFRIFNLDNYPSLPPGYTEMRWFNPDQPDDAVYRMDYEYESFKKSNLKLYQSMWADVKRMNPKVVKEIRQIYKEHFLQNLNYETGATYIAPLDENADKVSDPNLQASLDDLHSELLKPKWDAI